MLSDDEKKILTSAYFEAAGQGSYSGLDKFYRSLKSKGLKVSKKDVQQWLQDQPSYSLFKPLRKKSKRPCTI